MSPEGHSDDRSGKCVPTSKIQSYMPKGSVTVFQRVTEREERIVVSEETRGKKRSVEQLVEALQETRGGKFVIVALVNSTLSHSKSS